MSGSVADVISVDVSDGAVVVEPSPKMQKTDQKDNGTGKKTPTKGMGLQIVFCKTCWGWWWIDGLIVCVVRAEIHNLFPPVSSILLTNSCPLSFQPDTILCHQHLLWLKSWGWQVHANRGLRPPMVAYFTSLMLFHCCCTQPWIHSGTARNFPWTKTMLCFWRTWCECLTFWRHWPSSVRCWVERKRESLRKRSSRRHCGSFPYSSAVLCCKTLALTF